MEDRPMAKGIDVYIKGFEARPQGDGKLRYEVKFVVVGPDFEFTIPVGVEKLSDETEVIRVARGRLHEIVSAVIAKTAGWAST